ncbi:MAG: methionine gamma-lyase family protein [Lachnospiraceae bacterium]|nr:methionine gamma-lyase family protein [Lachnospiraceae bacterium]
MYEELGIDARVLKLAEETEAELSEQFARIDRVAEACQMKVLAAMRKNRISEMHLHGTTGYGYNDAGRDGLERVYADIFRAEDALVRAQITCGTHALNVAIASQLRPGDEIFSATGAPYDTLEEVIGIRPSPGSLAEMGITYAQADLLPDGGFDFDAIRAGINDRTKMVIMQRSRGYSSRPSLTIGRLEELIAFVRSVKPEVIIMVDNCYGEFIEEREPVEIGADMAVGSLIKNPGGGLASSGGYIVGTKACIERAAYRLSSPGLGKEVGASLGQNPSFFQGIFLAPTVTAGAEKGAVFAAKLYQKLGFEVFPGPDEPRADIIQNIRLGTPEKLVSFCRGIQAAAPIDSYVTPEPWDMPGYDSQVIMAAGAFVQGSSIELSADGPLRPPYDVFLQGGLTWYHAKAGVLMSVQALLEDGLLDL